jgi:hypothetical protein
MVNKVSLFTVLIMFSTLSVGTTIPENAKKYAPMLKKELQERWPDSPKRSYFAGQIEQETCVSLQSKKCWSPQAELKTSREYGFGLGQVTKTDRFDNFQEAKKLDKSLMPWKWENRFDPVYQIRTLVLMDKSLYNRLPKEVLDREAFMLSAYNGGMGSVLNDRRLCKSTKGCDPNLWFANVEITSFKSRIKLPGYGEDFFSINRKYVSNILIKRHEKYISIMNS